MKDAGKRTLFWIVIFLIVLLPSSTYIGYKFGYRNALKEKEIEAIKIKSKESIAVKKRKKVLYKQPEEQKEETKIEQGQEERYQGQQQGYNISCERAKSNLLDFLEYLNHKNYINKYCKGKDIKIVLSEIVKKLSYNPPVCQGEGVNSEIMLKNIYFFSRTLSIDEIRLIKEILEKESDQMEFVLKWAYIWLINKDRCLDPYGLLPNLEIAYRYACFFLNTIGGRAYLFRRSDPIRILLTYYSLLIIYKMNEKGKNIYGVNVSPISIKLEKEIKRYPELLFQKEYLNMIKKMAYYY